jgi:hypothetical protein
VHLARNKTADIELHIKLCKMNDSPFTPFCPLPLFKTPRPKILLYTTTPENQVNYVKNGCFFINLLAAMLYEA